VFLDFLKKSIQASAKASVFFVIALAYVYLQALTFYAIYIKIKPEERFKIIDLTPEEAKILKEELIRISDSYENLQIPKMVDDTYFFDAVKFPFSKEQRLKDYENVLELCQELGKCSTKSLFVFDKFGNIFFSANNQFISAQPLDFLKSFYLRDPVFSLRDLIAYLHSLVYFSELALEVIDLLLEIGLLLFNIILSTLVFCGWAVASLILGLICYLGSLALGKNLLFSEAYSLSNILFFIVVSVALVLFEFLNLSYHPGIGYKFLAIYLLILLCSLMLYERKCESVSGSD